MPLMPGQVIGGPQYVVLWNARTAFGLAQWFLTARYIVQEDTQVPQIFHLGTFQIAIIDLN